MFPICQQLVINYFLVYNCSMRKKENKEDHPFSWMALARITIAGLVVFLAWRALGVFVDMLIALIIATAIYPIVRKFHKKMSLILSTALAFLLVLIPFALISIFVIPNLVRQIPDLINALPVIVNKISFLPKMSADFDLTSYISNHADFLLASTTSIATTTLTIITIFFMVFYFVLDSEQLLGFFLEIFPDEEQREIRGMLLKVATVNAQYISGSVVIALICSLFVFIGLCALTIPFALPLAILAGLMSLLPLIGGLIGGIPAIIMAFAIAPWKGVLFLCAYCIYQQLQGTVIAPLVYKKALHISPALSFLAIIFGGGLFGILGAFLALPIAASIPAMIHYFRDYKERNK